MSSPMSRRCFLSQASAACAVGLAGNLAIAAPESDRCSIPLLGDLHFDRPEHHDMDWLAKEHPGDVRQVENYCRITAERMRPLLDKVGGACRRLQAAGTSVPFVLQLGDLVEGLCGSEQLARRQASDAIEFVEHAKLPVPMAITKGNHDVTGPGAVTVYNESLIPFVAKGLKAKVTKATFTQSVAGSLLVFYDAYDRASLDWFAGVLDELKPRRLIVAIHPPVVPYNARSTWHIYSSPKQQEQRTRLLDLLGRHRALVLCGHLHKYSFLVRRTDSGHFAQLAISSVASTSDGRAKDVLQGVDDYRPDLVDLEPSHSPDTVATRRKWLAAERPFIERFEYADTWGHAALHLRGEKASVDVFRGFDEQPWKSIEATS